MKELGITKGEYSWERYEYLSYVKAGGKMICSFTELPNDQELALCKLFTDAGNTAQKCGLLPSELLRQRDELREALQSLMGGVRGLPPLTAIAGIFIST